jgi:hypothetical protein
MRFAVVPDERTLRAEGDREVEEEIAKNRNA